MPASASKLRRFLGTGAGVGCLVILLGIAFFLGRVSIVTTTGLTLARLHAAEADLTAIETSIAGMLADAKRKNLRDLFTTYPGKDAVYATADEANAALRELVPRHTEAMYALLQHGRDAQLPEGFELADVNLYPSYLDLRTDPWGNPYQFFIGPWPGPVATPFRMFEVTEQADGLRNHVAPAAYDGKIDETDPYFGAPGAAPRHGVYVWSTGEDASSGVGQTTGNERDNAFRSGDDPNNWDPGHGWKAWY